jgi:predicted ATPase
MINTLRISRFKSIRELSLDCKRINVFIGEPNTGKSNILESLGLLSFLHYCQFGYMDKAKQFVRFERTANLFYDEALDKSVAIKCDEIALELDYGEGGFQGQCGVPNGAIHIRGDHSDIRVDSWSGRTNEIAQFKFYRFRVKESFQRRESDFLLPPSGDNLLSLLVAKPELRSIVNEPFVSLGLRLGLRPQENKIEVVKSFEDIIISYPYSLTSDTLQRLTFHVVAIRSNENSILVFEEPESHSFPHHVKSLAEQIALDENNNQYFIATHNPYFLLPLLEKASKEDVSVNIVYYEDHETKTRELAPEALPELAEIDVFSNLERYLAA